MNLTTRFLKYVSFDTQSSTTSGTTPSTSKQLLFAEHLKQELLSIRLIDVTLDELGYLFATLPANTDKSLPTIGFIAHLDTSPDMSGENVTPRIVPNYQGEAIVLNEADQTILSPNDFPELLHYLGNDLIVTDGKTLLGADDKAGIAEIVTAMEYLQTHPEVIHGKIRVAFNPDEEIGEGAHHFDVAAFGCDWAYTIDGGEIGELEYENFNAASAKITCKGRNVHPGYAKDKMVNATLLAAEFISNLPSNQVPEQTTGYEGFYHLVGMQGDVEQTTLTYIIRDHDLTLFEQKKAFIQHCVDQLNAKHTKGAVSVEITDQYFNMREKIEPLMHIIDTAFEAMEAVGVKPNVKPIRGGTDGAQLSFKGLPCPNIFAGGHNFHGRYEFVPIQSMQKSVEVIVKIAELVAKK